ncbi:uncharacterized protein HQ_2348A [Haloquadratum walsbyi DSM 16790]|uniref:Uncharacterized protein n=1 Tax=Haloquadratum walsbyi (strain DSM 16790 / HBSQ001) TaxID=362976 RepID=Q18HR6_HALWD|nr:uncharacterized protein HQ_2348A [Haloquadratum walsbyi DSM 16790]
MLPRPHETTEETEETAVARGYSVCQREQGKDVTTHYVCMSNTSAVSSS